MGEVVVMMGVPRKRKSREIPFKAGGLAGKDKRSGTAHAEEKGNELVKNPDFFALYSQLVTLTNDEVNYYSCGMKAFGLPDVMTSTSIPPEAARDLLQNFNLDHIIKSPSMKRLETYSLGGNSPLYQIQYTHEFRYEEDHVFFNPFGLVNLLPYENTKSNAKFIINNKACSQVKGKQSPQVGDCFILSLR